MLSLILAVGLATQVPTMAEVRTKIFDEARVAKSFSDSWSLERDGQFIMKINRTVSNEKYRIDYTGETEVVSSTGFDGQVAWGIMFQPRTYFEDTTRVKVNEKDVLLPLKGEGSLEATFVNGRDLRIVASPDFKVVSMIDVNLDGQPARLLKAEAIKSTGRLDLQMWLDPAYWIPLRAEVSGGKTGGPQLDLVYKRESYTKDPAFTLDAFSLNRSLVTGFTKLDKMPN